MCDVRDSNHATWAVLFSHPADYTPVCSTELGAAALQHCEFQKRGVKMLEVSVDSVESHKGWVKDIQVLYSMSEKRFPFPLASVSRQLLSDLGMLDPDEVDSTGLPLTARCVFVIGPDKKLKLSILYPATTGRNFHEILRVIDSLQLTANSKVATPANWKKGEKCRVIPSLSDEEAVKLFPKGFEVTEVPSKKSYIRLTPDPSI
uniref:peroxiredoxin-6-like isoform X2 n=1 Tax=Ciona intestinalis TaxID=7719 RepID=UPI000EF52414|nr:peroxiredoxin-6-like isoform X2 [Ciona intestinalis]|eukprot:XP_026691755.1 peroxiredoxin-6-like isoform X2 [Ciona intestinalis]